MIYHIQVTLIFTYKEIVIINTGLVLLAPYFIASSDFVM